MITTIVSGMVFARTLSIADYGTYLQTFVAYDFAVPILTLGLPSALYYFLPNERKRQKGLILDNLLLLVICALIFTLFLALGGTQLLASRFSNPNLAKTLQWMTFYPLYTVPVLLSTAVWITMDKVKLNAVVNVTKGMFLTFGLVITAVLYKGYEGPTLVRIFLPLLFLPIYIYYIFKFASGPIRPNIASMWRLAKFSIPLGLASVFGTLALQLEKVIVSMLTTPKEFAVYANGAKEVPLIGIITGSISMVIMADMSKKIREGNFKAALDLFRKAATVSAIFLMPVMVFLLIHAVSFIDILFSDKYKASVVPFRIYLIAIPIRIAYYGAAFVALGKTKAILLRSIIDLLLTGILCYLFVYWLGAYGAAIGLVLTLFLWSVPYNLYSLSRSFSCSPLYILPFTQVGKILLISIIAGLASAIVFLFNWPAIFSFAVGGTIFAALYSLFGYLYIPDFREVVVQYSHKIRK